MYRMILLLLLVLTGCLDRLPEKEKSMQQKINEIRHLDKTPLMNISAFVREQRREDVTAIQFSDFESNPSISNFSF